jgi:hypothetical protein
MARRWLFVVVALVPAGCSDSNPSGGSQEMDAYEAAVRFVLPRAAQAAGNKRPVVYLDLEDKDAAKQLCRRFKDHAFPVIPLESKPRQAPGQAAYVIRISAVSGEKVQWEGPDQARVFLLDHPAGETLKCGTPYPVRVRRQGARWKVVTD